MPGAIGTVYCFAPPISWLPRNTSKIASAILPPVGQPCLVSQTILIVYLSLTCRRREARVALPEQPVPELAAASSCLRRGSSHSAACPRADRPAWDSQSGYARRGFPCAPGRNGSPLQKSSTSISDRAKGAIPG